MTTLAGCDIEARQGGKAKEYGAGFTTEKIDSCKYVLYVGNNSGDIALVHAGDCSNPIHRTPSANQQ